MYFQQTFDINYYYYHYCYRTCIITVEEKELLSKQVKQNLFD